MIYIRIYVRIYVILFMLGFMLVFMLEFMLELYRTELISYQSHTKLIESSKFINYLQLNSV